jgi:hypothetical protein
MIGNIRNGTDSMATDEYRRLIRHGAVIFLLANVSGWVLLAAPLRNPRMMLATHIAALFGALLMMAVGMLGPQLDAGVKARAVLVWSLLVSQYAFVGSGVYAAVMGTSSMFAGPAGARGTEAQETVAIAGNAAGIVGSTAAAIVLVWSLRGGRPSPR